MVGSDDQYSAVLQLTVDHSAAIGIRIHSVRYHPNDLVGNQLHKFRVIRLKFRGQFFDDRFFRVFFALAEIHEIRRQYDIPRCQNHQNYNYYSTHLFLR